VARLFQRAQLAAGQLDGGEGGAARLLAPLSRTESEVQQKDQHREQSEHDEQPGHHRDHAGATVPRRLGGLAEELAAGGVQFAVGGDHHAGGHVEFLLGGVEDADEVHRLRRHLDVLVRAVGVNADDMAGRGLHLAEFEVGGDETLPGQPVAFEGLSHARVDPAEHKQIGVDRQARVEHLAARRVEGLDGDFHPVADVRLGRFDDDIGLIGFELAAGLGRTRSRAAAAGQKSGPKRGNREQCEGGEEAPDHRRASLARRLKKRIRLRS